MGVIKPLIKNDFMIVKLIMTDNEGLPLKKPFKLQRGENIFRCKALYNDGSEEYFDPYWTCPIIYRKTGFENGVPRRGVEVKVWRVFGQRKRDSVPVYAEQNHERYTELACWVFPPKEKTPTGNAEIPHDSTGFDYEAIT